MKEKLVVGFLVFCKAAAAPPVPASSAKVAVSWTDPVQVVSTHASLQVVSHRYLARDSPIHDSSFELLKQLRPHYTRYVPWAPMPEYGYCEPTAPVGVGTPQCEASWDCTLPDQMMADFWNAVDGDAQEAIPNFSTQPPWLYPATRTAPASNLTALGDYYGRLLAWYTKGGMTDECGEVHSSGHRYNITIWEVFNEPIAEYSHTKETYTAEFDAVVQGIRRLADPEHRIKFIGMNLANIRPVSEVQEWVKYFLDPSNHAEDCRDALDYIGYHSYPTADKYTDDPSTLSLFFNYIDSFVDEVDSTNQLVKSLSPTTKTMLDECGTTETKVLVDRSNPQSGPLYWLASGTSFVYLYLKVAALPGAAVPVVGMSQLMDDVNREPGVSMIDWTNGNGTARYWALRLLRENCEPGDTFVPTQVAPVGEVFAQGVLSAGRANPRVVLVNKRYEEVTVTFAGMRACYALVVDEGSKEGPARRVDCNKDVSVALGPFASAVVYDQSGSTTEELLV